MTKVAVTRYKDLTRWDVKTYLYTLDSNFPIVSLAPYLIENTNRVKPFEHPEQEFDILGVTNKNGIYFNETLLGSKINQPYYQVDGGDIFYNPYRVNVGSIGIVPQEFHHKYTSPAYVVFKTKSDELLSEYLLFVMKSEWFNETLRAFTSGSVRQNLTFALLGELKIPLPPLDVQQHIIDLWNKAQTSSQESLNEAERLKKEIDDYLMSELGITVQKQEKSKVFTTRFKDLERWDVGYRNLYTNIQFSSHVTVDNILNYVNVISGVTFSKDQEREQGHILLRSNNIDLSSNTLNLQQDELKYIDSFVILSEDRKLYNDDIFMCTNSGSKDHIGKVAYIENIKEALYFGSFMSVIRLKRDKKFIIKSKFLFYFMCSYPYKVILNNILGNTTTINNLSLEKMKNIKIPLPPMEKQEEIVAHITALRSQISQLTTSAHETLSSTQENIKNIIIK